MYNYIIKTMRAKRWRIHYVIAITLCLDNVDIVWLFLKIEFERPYAKHFLILSIIT